MFTVKPEFSNLMTNWQYGSNEKKTEFPLNISNITPARPKNTGTWVVNTNEYQKRSKLKHPLL